MTAADILFSVGGADASCPFLTALLLGSGSSFFANANVPNGTFWLGDRASATGAFIARDIIIGKNSSVSLATRFAGLSKPAAAWALEPAEDHAPASIPTSFALLQNYPNPFNPSTQIRYALPQGAPVTLIVCDILGREVTRLVAGEFEQAGYHEVKWEGRNMEGNPVGSGIYFYRLQAGKFTDVRKMILLR
jgi:hypothetical protein